MLFAVYVKSSKGASSPSDEKEILYSVSPYASLITSCGVFTSVLPQAENTARLTTHNINITTLEKNFFIAPSIKAESDTPVFAGVCRSFGFYR